MNDREFAEMINYAEKRAEAQAWTRYEKSIEPEEEIDIVMLEQEENCEND